MNAPFAGIYTIQPKISFTSIDQPKYKESFHGKHQDITPSEEESRPIKKIKK